MTNMLYFGTWKIHDVFNFTLQKVGFLALRVYVYISAFRVQFLHCKCRLGCLVKRYKTAKKRSVASFGSIPFTQWLYPKTSTSCLPKHITAISLRPQRTQDFADLIRHHPLGRSSADVLKPIAYGWWGKLTRDAKTIRVSTIHWFSRGFSSLPGPSLNEQLVPWRWQRLIVQALPL